MLEAGYLEGEQGPFFYVLHPPAAESVRGAVLYFHPFAEELNKSRRMAALQARRLAADGYAVLLPDHYGCGDSGGDFGDARWETWVGDLGCCVDWLRARYAAPLVLWGLRTGCLLLGDLLRARGPDVAGTVLWQPVTSGEQYLVQFLRLRMAAAMMGGDKETTAELRRRLADGETLEVAGYRLSPSLAEALARARLQAPVRGKVHWLEIAAAEAEEISPASRRVLDGWTAQGVAVDAATVAGEPFWATQEIREAPALLEQTARRLAEAS